MALVLQPDIVRYGCTCGTLNPISKIYFCRHCLKVRCGYCLCHEVDSHYCANCLENLPSAEARLKKNCCATCYDCPSCFHTLSTRATTVSSPNPDDPNKVVSRKFYYLACAFCRWSTRDAGIPDQTVASGMWPERENPHTTRVNNLIEYYKIVAMQERLEKERKKFVPRSRNYLSLTDKFGLSAAMARKRAGLAPLPGASMKDIVNVPVVGAAEATEEVDLLPEDIFVKPVDLLSLTTMEQRLAEPDKQPVLVTQLIPSRKLLFIKRSQRCRICEHNVSKPEYNPVSIKFKIQLSAYYHMPEVRVFTCEPLRLGSVSELLLKLCNPTQNATSIQFLPLPDTNIVAVKEEGEIKQDATSSSQLGEKKDDVVKKEMGGGDVATSQLQQLSLSKRMLSASLHINGVVTLPECVVQLPQRDDAAEYDDSGDTHSFQDDPKVVTWRKGNKAMVKMSVVPQGSITKEVTIGFLLKYSYVNLMTSVGNEQKEKQKADLIVPVYVKIGRIVGNN